MIGTRPGIDSRSAARGGRGRQRPHGALIPLALRGVRYTPSSAHDLLRRNLLVYGLGGLVLPFAGIKLIDLVISAVPGLG
ncbi:hypothetical protein ACWGJB_30180 [Streptomyces sp. NPDC054813]